MKKTQTFRIFLKEFEIKMEEQKKKNHFLKFSARNHTALAKI